MGIEQNKTLVRRFYEEIINTGNVDKIAEHGGAANMLEPFLNVGAIKVVTS